jgi:hypothetical protein
VTPSTTRQTRRVELSANPLAVTKYRVDSSAWYARSSPGLLETFRFPRRPRCTIAKGTCLPAPLHVQSSMSSKHCRQVAFAFELHHGAPPPCAARGGQPKPTIVPYDPELAVMDGRAVRIVVRKMKPPKRRPWLVMRTEGDSLAHDAKDLANDGCKRHLGRTLSTHSRGRTPTRPREHLKPVVLRSTLRAPGTRTSRSTSP